MTQSTYEPNWNSLTTYPVAPWFRDAKYGIYTHWGPYSVPAYGPNGTWYPHRMYDPKSPIYKHHVAKWGHPGKFGYKDFVPMFTAEKFDAEQWADLFRRAGAKFAGPVAEHHDGFSMWDSKLTKWNSVEMGPKRNVVGELAKAYRAAGMKYITTFHHSHNWWFFPTWNEEMDCSNPEWGGLYSRPHPKAERPDAEYLDRWLGKLVEVIDGYEPDLIWFDFGLGNIMESYRKRFLAYYYNKSLEWGRDVVVTFKQFQGEYHLPPGSGVDDLEVGKKNELTPYKWLTDTTVDAGPRGTWSHVTYIGFKPVDRLVHNLIDRVSKNGYLLLNVGPRADGTIPEGAQESLLGIGKWLEVNGEGIFGTVPWYVSGEGPTGGEGGTHFNEDNEPRFTAHDIRFTVKDDCVYAFVLGRPGDEVRIKKLGKFYEQEIESVTMLGVDGELPWRMDYEGLWITTPQKMPCDHAVCFRVKLKKTAM